MAGGAAEAQAGGKDARALHDAHVDWVADGVPLKPRLADGGQAVGEAGIVGLLDGAGLLLGDGLDTRQSLSSSGQVAREVQVGVVGPGMTVLPVQSLDLVALGDLGAGTGVGRDLLAIDENEGVVDGAARVPSTRMPPTKCVLAHDESSSQRRTNLLAAITCAPARLEPKMARIAKPMATGDRDGPLDRLEGRGREGARP